MTLLDISFSSLLKAENPVLRSLRKMQPAGTRIKKHGKECRADLPILFRVYELIYGLSFID